MGILEELWISAYQYITDIEMWIRVISVTIKILVIIVGARIIVHVTRKTIQEVVKKRDNNLLMMDERRINTVSTLLSNVVGYVVYFIMGLMILTQFFEVTPILAGAGVVGLAVGFGAQSLVKDVITGFFILFEDQFAVGDFVKVGNFHGTVIDFGLRVTKIKNWSGEIYIIPNGSIGEVTNVSKADSVAAVDIGVAYEENVGEVKKVLETILEQATQEIEDIVGEVKVMGVQELGPSEVILRVTAVCKPAAHWGVSRALREKIKEEFDLRGIEIPYPRLVTYKRSEGATQNP
ncbi:mechanosensitive ion channel protein MscS [Desulfuribacillus stibiiarsenatis]|uniref:Mechanosensitive ion channel protein MscS n=1 Tax=Desulfuribacillus stibiiarsenatis TaxID=1390249 RepID=A0A1E5L9Y8_9FIRM|nr:mechanosensitive ion channel family protein [Desulfuribacillus stibiiarsenatis]OEH86940.1 mechanosensitive ion channel protein MscS [Desulfuribacillus stibiiarsenatis]